MGRHSTQRGARRGGPPRRLVRIVVATAAAGALAFTSAAAGISAAVASPGHGTASPVLQAGVVRYSIPRGYVLVDAVRDRFSVVQVTAHSTTTRTGTFDTGTSAAFATPATAQAYAAALSASRGWGTGQFACLLKLWNQESSWNMNAENPSSGAYGIPQALPGDKMGPGWQDDYRVQIAWGLGYIAARYGDPCGAWASEVSNGSY